MQSRLVNGLSAAAIALALAAPATGAGTMLPGKGKTVRPIEGPLAEEKFQARIIYRALEELGYRIASPEQAASYEIAHWRVNFRQADFFTAHWDPQHRPFFEAAGGSGNMQPLGVLIEGARQGYLIDKASHDAGITSLKDLQDAKNARRFDGDGDGRADLVGCAPGWGCAEIINAHLERLDLQERVKQHQGSYSRLMDDAIARHQQNQGIIYYAWTPYWVSAVLKLGRDVEWLEVPDNPAAAGGRIGFANNNIRILANKKFLADNPAARKLFEIAKIRSSDVSVQNLKIRNGQDADSDIDGHVSGWIIANRNIFTAWLQAARKAAKDSQVASLQEQP